MKIIKKTLKYCLYFLLVPTTYVLVSLILTAIPVDRREELINTNKTIYLSTNGVHLDIIIPKKDATDLLLKGIKLDDKTEYLSFGWGDENFYINTPTWNDLTFNNAFSALFLKSTTLMHVSKYKQKRKNWLEISITEVEFEKLNTYLFNSFETQENGMKVILKNKGYGYTDDFYKAKGSYSCFKTCNSWVNTGFKKSGLKACLWTPFDFGLLNKYD